VSRLFSQRISQRSLVSIMAAVVASAGLALAPVAPASTNAAAAPQPETAGAPQPTAKARAAGIAKAGDAFMGWSTPKSAAAQATPAMAPAASVYGIDVSGHQGNVNWPAQWNAGKRFVWVKATESITYRNPYFAQQYNGSYNQGFIRGAYHFALPDRSTGAAQANYFSNNGGGWSGDGRTLPGALDMEYNPYGPTCYGKSQAAMAAWIRDFSNTYKARWNKYPAIYTSTSWWSQCVGNNSFAATNPLWVARYASAPGTLPYNWGFYTVWQYSSSPIDQNVFNGDMTRLRVFATNHD
jgi:GH25 family lysozyme M1 (1,4-beta-N-acetylmuramidase)